MADQQGMENFTDLVRTTGMRCIIEKSHRRFGPSLNYHGDLPPRGTEVFVKNIPKECFEPDLYPIFLKYGEIYQMKISMDAFGTNRGYCFVKYYSPDAAQRAILNLNNYEIRKDFLLSVTLSAENCRLFIRGFPMDKSKDEIYQEISNLTANVVKVVCYPFIHDKTKHRGFAIIQYKTHEAAETAKLKLITKNVKMFGLQIQVSWADFMKDPEIGNLHKVKRLFVKNLSLETTEKTLLELFNLCSENSVEMVKKIKDFAFINFTSIEKAELAKETFPSDTIDGSIIEISWAKPQYTSQKYKSRGRNIRNYSSPYFRENQSMTSQNMNNPSMSNWSMYGPRPTNYYN